MAEIVMPRLSDTMEEGTILSWLIADGELVKRGQELVEIETDKANMTYESDQEGVLQRIAAEGDTLPVGAVIAHIGSSDDAGARAVEEAPERKVNNGAASSREVPLAKDSAGERVKASPLARRIASERGVDLQAVRGSGPGGRIVKDDVLQSTTGQQPAHPPAGVTTAKGESTVVELSRTQQTIARRMAESKATIPHFALQSDVDMEACVALRSELKDAIPTHPAPTYNDMVVKACALALREHPKANGSYRDGQLQLYSRINVGVAVAAQDALVVPTVFDADSKSLGEIARETRALAERVRAGTITPPELGGGTFT
ncbi:MAG TPA: dihydrolipoamide acetyltransferase family protein, partial [Solirubrobacteraceae bacterium]|nr:dihydrolipoamide acetyltransferase family protein [Solirubrobacteraceae bacterium]